MKKDCFEKNTGNVIVLNRMYVGDYLSTNLGHEVINMYTADNGKHYLYLNAYGSFAAKWAGQIGSMLLTKYHSKDCVEVIGKAVGLSDVYKYTEGEGNKRSAGAKILEGQLTVIQKISYGGVHLEKIFSESERQNVYVTFEAERVFKINSQKSIFIHFVPQKRNGVVLPQRKDASINHNENRIDVYLVENKLALASLNQFVSEGADFSVLNELMGQDSYNDFWVELGDNDKVPQNLKVVDKHIDVSLFDICQIQNDENCFSNALAYFMQLSRYKELWRGFFREVLKVKDCEMGDMLAVAREEVASISDTKEKQKLRDAVGNCSANGRQKVRVEGGRIDLVVRMENAILVIENKIKSDINSIEGDCDGMQLCRYYNYAKWMVSSENKNSSDQNKQTYFFILSPEYNKPNLKEQVEGELPRMSDIYTIITYSDLYNYLEKQKDVFSDDVNFVAFFNAMRRHTHSNVNDYLYYEMENTFYKRILESKGK